MALFTKQILTGAADGKRILVAATTTPGTTIHTAHATSHDEIWLYACNTHTGSVTLTLEWGEAVTSIVINMASNEGLLLVAPGLILTNSLVVKAYATVTNVVEIMGFVNRIT